jgi:phosphopantetheinyl transferase
VQIKSTKTFLWIFPIDSSQKILSDQEKYIASLLPEQRSIQYKISRGNIRFMISKLFKIDPLEVPLYSLPSAPPKLGKNFGFVSMSHCYDALIIGWSKNKIGIDIENSNRKILDKRIAKRFFNEKDNLRINNMKEDLLKKVLLKTWVMKESLIKWQNGNLLKGLKNWNIDDEFKIAIYKNEKLKAHVKNIRFKSWEIGLASSSKLNQDNIRINFYSD